MGAYFFKIPAEDLTANYVPLAFNWNANNANERFPKALNRSIEVTIFTVAGLCK
jgi:hypothetical protein